jgi:hypothetical protein
MSQFQDILDDEKTFADSIEFELGGRKVTLGDVRGLSRKKQQELSEKLADTERRRTEVLDLATKAAELKATLEAQVAEAGKTRPNPTDDDFDKDPFWEPVRKRVAAESASAKELKDNLTKLTNAMTMATSIWAEDRWQGQFERGKTRLKGDKFKDYTYEKVRDYAATNKILDKHGLPSVERAILELTKEDEKQVAIDEAFQRGLKEGQVKGRMGVMSRPTSAAGIKVPEKSVVAEKGLEGLGDDVAEDPELMKMLSDLGAVNPEDLVQ